MSIPNSLSLAPILPITPHNHLVHSLSLGLFLFYK